MVLKNDYRTGIDNLKKSLSIDSTALAGFYLTYAYMYGNQAIFPTERSILRRKAACLISNGDTVNANDCISLIRASINKSGLSEAVMESNLGSIYTWAGFPETGELHARKAFNIDSRNFLYTFNLARLPIDNNVDVDEGTHFVSLVLDSLSREKYRDYYSSLLILKGVGKFKQGMYNEAVENLENGFKNTPTSLPDLQHYLPEARQALVKEKSTSAQDPEPSTQNRNER